MGKAVSDWLGKAGKYLEVKPAGDSIISLHIMASTPTRVEIEEFLGYELLKDINKLVNLYGFRQQERSDVELEFYRAGLNLEKLRRAFKTSPLGFDPVNGRCADSRT